MKTIVWIVVLAALGLAGCANEPEKKAMGFVPSKTEPISAGSMSAGNEGKDVLIRQVAAQNREDAEGYLMTIDPSAPVYEPTKLKVAEIFEAYDLVTTIERMEVVDVTDSEMSIRTTVTVVKKSGPDFQDNRFTSINKLRKVDGKWLMYDTTPEKVEKVN